MVRNKRAVSAMIGYVLLISVGIVLSIIVYNSLKSYVPKDFLECPEGTSILLKNYECVGDSLNLTLKNNGKFNYEGYSIYGANVTGAEIATINLANNFVMGLDEQKARKILDGYVQFSTVNNDFMKPQVEAIHVFDLDSTGIIRLEITPVRYQKVENKDTFVSCGNAKIVEEISC